MSGKPWVSPMTAPDPQGAQCWNMEPAHFRRYIQPISPFHPYLDFEVPVLFQHPSQLGNIRQEEMRSSAPVMQGEGFEQSRMASKSALRINVSRTRKGLAVFVTTIVVVIGGGQSEPKDSGHGV